MKNGKEGNKDIRKKQKKETYRNTNADEQSPWKCYLRADEKSKHIFCLTFSKDVMEHLLSVNEHETKKQHSEEAVGKWLKEQKHKQTELSKEINEKETKTKVAH